MMKKLKITSKNNKGHGFDNAIMNRSCINITGVRFRTVHELIAQFKIGGGGERRTDITRRFARGTDLTLNPSRRIKLVCESKALET